MQAYVKVDSKKAPDVSIKVIKGHFVTPNSHVNYYFDLTTMKSRLSEASNVARALAQDYLATTVVDSIVCMEGTEVIGAFLAAELTRAGLITVNQHKTIYIISPEYDASGQMIFRDNMQMMIRGKHVLILTAIASTGATLTRAMDSVHYYGGEVAGISAIFSAASRVAGQEIHALFTPQDVPDYRAYESHDCNLCKKGVRVDALCNGFGYSEVN